MASSILIVSPVVLAALIFFASKHPKSGVVIFSVMVIGKSGKEGSIDWRSS